MTLSLKRRDGSVVFFSLLIALALSVAAGAQQQLPTFSKVFDPATIGPGSQTTLRFTITNASGNPVTGVAFADNLPAGVTIASPANASSSCTGSLSAPDGGTTIAFADGAVGGGTTCTLLVNVTSATPGTHTNVTGDLTSSAGNSGTATADLVVSTDRPGFLKSFSPSSIFFQARSRMTLTFDNTANPSAAANLTVVDNLPPGMVVASPPLVAKTCSGGTVTAVAGSSVVSYTPNFFGDGSVGAGAACSVSLDVSGNAVGALGNVTGELTSIQPPSPTTRSSGKAGAVLTVDFESLRLTKQFTDDPAPPGGIVTLQFTVLNRDRDFSASDITFTDDLDAVLSGLEAVGSSTPDPPCGAGSSLTGTSLLTLAGGNLPPEGSCTFSIQVQIPAGATPGTYTNTTSSITGEINGDTRVGDPAEDLLVVQAAPSLTKTFVDDPVGGGSAVTLEFTITNTSQSSSATDIAFQDIFNDILPNASDVPANGFCGAGAVATFIPANPNVNNPSQLLVSGASLDPGASCTFSITLDVEVGAQAGTYPNVTSEITAIVDGAEVSGAPASDSLEVVGPPRLTKSFVDDPLPAGGAGSLEFELTLSEDSPGDVTDITFSDNLDATLSGLIALGLPINDVCGVGSALGGTPQTIVLTGGELAPGESCTFSVGIEVPAGAASGIYTNTTSNVSASVLGVNTVGLPATDDLRVAGLTLAKEFTDDPVLPGGQVNLRFTIDNTSALDAASAITFIDDLDAVIDNLAGVNLPQADVCGVGSSIFGISGNRTLVFQGGSLGAGESCSFDVTLQVPAAAQDGQYVNTTSGFSGEIGGNTIFFDNASDVLEVSSDVLELSKEFVGDPVAPGDQVTLRFTIDNLDPTISISDIAFTDDLEAALSGLVSKSGTLIDVCGVGSQISGTDVLTFTGGSLAGGTSCVFDVTLTVPRTVLPGTEVINTTSSATGDAGGLEVTGAPATDELEILFVAFSKQFLSEPNPGGEVLLSFTIENLSLTTNAGALSFFDDLDAVLAGLAAVGLPAFDVCGVGSQLSGTSFLTLTGGNLLTGGSCTFSVPLDVPADAVPGDYLNATSELTQFGIPVAEPATATLTVVGVVDSDQDGVLDGDDLCPRTVIPEGVPTVKLRPNRYALVDDDLIFDRGGDDLGRLFGGLSPRDSGSDSDSDSDSDGGQTVFDTTDTAGCSCEQIIEELELGEGHVKFGCSLGAMRSWVELVNSLSPATAGKIRF